MSFFVVRQKYEQLRIDIPGSLFVKHCMDLIDIGVNLMNRAFSMDRELVVQRAAQAGVSHLVITGTSEASSREAAGYAARYPHRLYATAGVHPHDVKNCSQGTLDALAAIAGQDCVAAIGECGLDYNRDFSPRDVQREWFEKQLRLAASLGLPVFLHERDAGEDFTAILKKHIGALKAALVHCFTGSRKDLEAYLDLGCYIGITGWICDERRGRHLAQLIKIIPEDRLMLETDSPYLLPRDLAEKVPGTKSGRNEPCFLPHIARAAAGHLGKDTEALAAQTSANARRFFRIQPS